MPSKKKGLSPETIKKLQELKRDKSENRNFSELKLKPFCNLEEMKKETKKEKQLPIEKTSQVATKSQKKAKEPKIKSVEKTTQIKSDIPPQHQQKEYRYGWNHERAEQARQRIAITKPWLYSTGAITNLGKQIVRRNALKHGLYSTVLKSSNLEFIELSVSTADIELDEAINNTQIEENEDTLKR